METKVCSKCGIEKPFCEFYKRNDNKSGYRKDCKLCFNFKNADYKNKNLNKIKKKAQERFQQNKKTFLEKKQNWRKNNPEEYKKQTKKYYESTKEGQ